jgi:hypothetical protein
MEKVEISSDRRDWMLRNGQIPDDWHRFRNHRMGLRFIPHAELIMPPKSVQFARVVHDSWWSVHPSLGYIYAGHSPQCNPNRAIAQDFTNRLYPGADVLFAHVALIPANPKDWA